MLYVDNRGIIRWPDRRAYRVGFKVVGAGNQAQRVSGLASPVFSRVESGDGGKREQGDSGRKPRQGSRDPADAGWAADCQSERGDVRYLARQGDRRAQGKDRVASGCLLYTSPSP